LFGSASRALPARCPVFFQIHLSQWSPQSLACSAIILNDDPGFMNGKILKNHESNKYRRRLSNPPEWISKRPRGGVC